MFSITDVRIFNLEYKREHTWLCYKNLARQILYFLSMSSVTLSVHNYYSGPVGARVKKDVRFQFFFFLCSKMHNRKTWRCLIGQCTIESTLRCFDWVMHNRSHVAVFTLVILRTVPTIVIAHTFCASPYTRFSYR